MSSSDPSPAGDTKSKPALKQVTLRWSGEGLRFEGGPEGVPPSIVDAGGPAGPSPMDHVLLGAAGCMGADVLDILRKSRVTVDGFEVEVEGRRAPEPPRRFLALTMIFHLTGPTEEERAKVERAVALSKDTYCSVLHSLRPDLDLDFEIRLR